MVKDPFWQWETEIRFGPAILSPAVRDASLSMEFFLGHPPAGIIMEQPPPSFEQHQVSGVKYGALGFAVLTMSDSRTPETDTSGQFIREAVAAAGHKVVRYALVKDDPNQIRPELQAALADQNVAVIVTNGGT